MQCPYCVSEVAEQALVCPVCRRDLYLFKSLLERIESLEQRVAAQDALLAERGPQLEEAASGSPSRTAPPPEGEEIPVLPKTREWLSRWLLPLVLLLVAHGLITVVYDLNTLYLRIVSLLIPLPFGLLMTAGACRSSLVQAFAAVSLALLAVLGMSGVTAWVDGTPVLPHGGREWREFIEYAASIGLSYTTGMLVGQISRWRKRAAAFREADMAVALARLVRSGGEHTEQFQAAVQKFNELGGALTAAATTVLSVYTGLKGVIGN